MTAGPSFISLSPIAYQTVGDKSRMVAWLPFSDIVLDIEYLKYQPHQT